MTICDLLLQVLSGAIGCALGAVVFYPDVVADEWRKLRAWWRK